MPVAMVVLAHPIQGSFNHAIALSIASGLTDAGFDVRSHDLYAEGFDPLGSVQESDTSREPADLLADTPDEVVRQHRRDLIAADALVIVHPNWWGKPPAMMAGWMDRVLIPGVAYTLDDPIGIPTSLLQLRSLFVVNTSDTTAERERALFGDPLQLIWERCVSSYLGDPYFERRVIRTVSDSTPELRKEWLATVRRDAERIGRLP